MDAAQDRPGGARQGSLRRVVGLLLIVVVAALGVYALLFFQFGCEYDCGDSGGRGVFLLVTLTSPVAVVGAWLIVNSTMQDARAGRPPAPLWKLVVRVIWVALVLAIVLSGLLALALFAMTVGAVVYPDSASFEGDDLGPAVYAIFGALWTGLTWLGWVAARQMKQLLRDWDITTRWAVDGKPARVADDGRK